MAVAYIMRSYPRLSQTFILNEILALERLGLEIEIFGMTDPGEPITQSGVGEVRAPTRYLDSSGRRRWAVFAEHARLAARSPRRYATTAGYVLRRRDLDRGYTTASRFTCFLQAVHLARLIGGRNGSAPRVAHVHSHFAHDPTLIALLVKRLTGVPYSFTAHARDLYQTPVRALAERVSEATAVVTCCGANRSYLERVAPKGRAKIELIHHGVDVSTFQPSADGHGSAVPLIVSVGRLVEKKGFGDLIRACDLLSDRGHRFECVIYGDGPLRERLLELIDQLGLEGRVRLAGARAQAELVAELARATVFALAPMVTDDGDRDGIPNVLVEAMACGLAVATTAAGGVPELVIHGRTGLLAAPGDVAAIADNLAALIGRPALRRRLGSRARKMVAEGFDVDANARRLVPILTTSGGTG
jgi:glycosyltransferase involved in cell wall biosynthesis